MTSVAVVADPSVSPVLVVRTVDVDGEDEKAIEESKDGVCDTVESKEVPRPFAILSVLAGAELVA